MHPTPAATTTLDGPQLAGRLEALDRWLTDEAPLWSVPPFRVWRAPWQDADGELGALAAWVDGLDEATVARLEADPAAPVGAPSAWSARVAQARALVSVGPVAVEAATADRAPRIKARKGAQVAGFLAAAGHALRDGEGPIVEWCSGRGHLGRALAERTGRSALLLERDPSLCAPPHGAPEHARVGHRCVDVLDDAVHAVLPDGASYVGLHACGRLTDRLLDVALVRGAQAIAAAPCCPHRLFGRDRYLPRSRPGRVSRLALGPETLRLAVLDDVVASPRQRALRHREHLLRVAVDLLVREATGLDAYRAFPSVRPAQVDRPLAEFVAWAQRTYDLPLPAVWDPERVERAAADRLRRIRAAALVRALARRPLELWLVLDRAASLVEAGMHVTVGTFCAREVSPRNLLMVARA